MTPALAHRTLARRLGAAVTWRRVGILATVALLSPAPPVGCLRWVDPPTSAFILRYRFSAPAEAPPVRYLWVDGEHIAPAMALAVVAAEDQRFPVHRGFDLESVERALEERREGEPLRGASTISQQVAKNLFLWPGRSWLRKGLEAWVTVWIETLWPKARILEVYLNVAELGEGIYGVEAAARRYFDKPAAALTDGEAARLAAVLPSPRRYSVSEPGPWTARRSDQILGQMRQLGPGWLEGAWTFGNEAR